MSKIIVSYRADDTGNISGRLDDFLVNRFGDNKVQLGLEGVIQPGDDFVEAIESAVKQTDVLVVLIGTQWTAGDWLNDADDYDQIALKTALEEKVRIMPVLVDGATMPTADQLPEAFASLARRAGVDVSEENFRDDAGQLADQLDKHVQAKPAPKSEPAPVQQQSRPATPTSAQQPAPKPSIFTPATSAPVTASSANTEAGVNMPEFVTNLVGNLIKSTSDYVAIIGITAILFGIAGLIDLDYLVYNFQSVADNAFIYSVITSALYGVGIYFIMYGVSIITPRVSTKTAMAVVAVYALVSIISAQIDSDSDATQWLIRAALAGAMAFVVSEFNTAVYEGGELRLNQQFAGMVFVGLIIITFLYTEISQDVFTDADSFTDVRIRIALMTAAQGAAIAGLMLFAFKSADKERETTLPPAA